MKEPSRKKIFPLIALIAGIAVAAALFVFAAAEGRRDTVLYNSDGALSEGRYKMTTASGKEFGVIVTRHGSRYRFEIEGETKLYITRKPYGELGLNYFKYDDSQEFDVRNVDGLYYLSRDGVDMSTGLRFES